MLLNKRTFRSNCRKHKKPSWFSLLCARSSLKHRLHTETSPAAFQPCLHDRTYLPARHHPWQSLLKPHPQASLVDRLQTFAQLPTKKLTRFHPALGSIKQVRGHHTILVDIDRNASSARYVPVRQQDHWKCHAVHNELKEDLAHCSPLQRNRCYGSSWVCFESFKAETRQQQSQGHSSLQCAGDHRERENLKWGWSQEGCLRDVSWHRDLDDCMLSGQIAVE